jgi:hypothetical protein
MNNTVRILTGLLLGVVMAGSLLATPIVGKFNTDGLAVIFPTTIDFAPAGGGTGNFTVSTGTGYFAASAVAPVHGILNTGTIADMSGVAEPAGVAVNISNYMSGFTPAFFSSMNFTLLGIGVATINPGPNVPGPCAGGSCPSPFNFATTSSNTTIFFDAFGTVTNGADSGGWTGRFSASTTDTRDQILAQIASVGSYSVSVSGAIEAFDNTSGIPEPATFGTMLLGGAFLAFGYIRRRKA